jgi:transcriptional regulator with PAS, ATPase and Fis domain
VAINCAAVQETLMETELFGHVRGSFTGAHRDKAGLFEVAAGGTAFLDEVGDLPLGLQARLLRFLQNREVRRVGDTVTRKVDVRVVAATHRDLAQMAKSGAFREDLFFRLNVIPIHMPPLRERKETIPALVRRFVIQSNARTRRRIRGVEASAQAAFMAYDYPGNVRELENMVEHAVTLADGDLIRMGDLPPAVIAAQDNRLSLLPPPDPASGVRTLTQVERDQILMVLKMTSGNRTETAKLLGVSRSTLWRKLKEHGLEDGASPAGQG